MAVAMTQIGKSYGFPVYINVNLTDAKLSTSRPAWRRWAAWSWDAGGADLFGHAGIVGTDHGGSLLWLVIDDEAMAYARRVSAGSRWMGSASCRGHRGGGPGGNYLSHEHTVRHFRKEFWLPDAVWQRAPYDIWVAAGGTSVADRALKRQRDLLEKHQPEPLDPKLAQEVDRIVEAPGASSSAERRRTMDRGPSSELLGDPKALGPPQGVMIRVVSAQSFVRRQPRFMDFRRQ